MIIRQLYNGGFDAILKVEYNKTCPKSRTCGTGLKGYCLKIKLNKSRKVSERPVQ